MLIKRKGLVWVLLALTGLAGCSGSSKHLAYVTLPTQNAIAAFRVDNHSGKLIQILGSPFGGGTSPASILVDPTGKFAYAANQGEDNISLFSINQSTGALTEVTPRTPAGVIPVSLGMDSGGHLLFVANEASASISSYSIDSAKGTLTANGNTPLPAGAGPTALVITPSGKFLYVACPNLGLVFAYSIASGGALQPVAQSPFPAGNTPVALAVDPSEHFMYVANALASTVSALAIDSSGALAPISGSPFSTCASSTTTCTTNPVAVAVHPAGKFLYVVNQSSNNVSAYSIDSGTGVPTLITDSPFSAGTGPVFATVDSTAKFLFVGNESSKDITEFSINASTGHLSGSIAAGTNSGPTSMSTTK